MFFIINLQIHRCPLHGKPVFEINIYREAYSSYSQEQESMGSNVYIRTGNYNKIVERGHNPTEYVNRAVEKELKRERTGGTREKKDEH